MFAYGSLYFILINNYCPIRVESVYKCMSTAVPYSGGLRLKFWSENLAAVLLCVYSGVPGK
jgi:hypothetical protein